MTPEIYKFIASPLGQWLPVPGTWLEADPAGRLRDQRNHEWFGEVIYQSDFPYLLAGLLPVWSPQVVNPTPNPEPYFLFRSRDDPNRDWRRTGPVKEPPPPPPIDPNDLFLDFTFQEII